MKIVKDGDQNWRTNKWVGVHVKCWYCGCEVELEEGDDLVPIVIYEDGQFYPEEKVLNGNIEEKLNPDGSRSRTEFGWHMQCPSCNKWRIIHLLDLLEVLEE